MQFLNRVTLGLGLACCLIGQAHAQQVDSELKQSKMHFEKKVSVKLTANYLLYLPKDYKADKKKQWPLMLFLHGSGERGSDLKKVALHGPPKLVKQGKEFPFIIVSPQCPKGQVWSVEVLNALLDQVEAKYRVDKSRVYLTGLSMGGYGTWALGLANPERFAAMAPICGGGYLLTYLINRDDKVRGPLYKKMPIWAFHGAKDPTVPPEESQRMVDILKKNGNKAVKLTIYPEAKHDSWTATYDNPELYDWLLKQKQGK